MRIHVVGGGPAGLMLAYLAKKLSPDTEVVVIDRDDPQAERGLGVLLTETTLARCREVAPDVYEQLEPALARWEMLEVRRRGERYATAGHSFVAVRRHALLTSLAEQCEAIGAIVKHGEVDHVSGDEATIVAVAEGLGSPTRERLAGDIGVRRRVHEPYFFWFGSREVFPCLSFIVVDTPFGLFQAHAYPIGQGQSTVVVQCSEDTWRAAGLAEADGETSAAICGELLGAEIGDSPLLAGDQRWRHFVTVRCNRLSIGNIVLLGDAAHSVHWSIGCGTKVAVEDAIALASAITEEGSVPAALARYELARRRPVERLQQAAHHSARFFDELDRLRHQPAPMFSFGLFTRSGRLTYDKLRVRDQAFGSRYDRWFAAHAGAGQAAVAPCPAATALVVNGVRIPNRTVARLSLRPPVDRGGAAVAALGAAQPGMVLLDDLAVSPAAAWAGGLAVGDPADPGVAARLIEAARSGGAGSVGVVLDHAGPAAGRRRRSDGRVMPGLGRAAVAASAGPLPPVRQGPIGSEGPLPRALAEEDLEAVTDAFVAAAHEVREMGADAVFVNMAHGHLLDTFLSPRSNVRDDRFGGSTEARLAFPLEVFRSVRAAWDGPLGAIISVHDGAVHGATVHAATLAGRLAAEGADVIGVEAGQGDDDALVWSDQQTLLDLADGVRAGGAPLVMVGGAALTLDEVNTAVASGRADLCVAGGELVVADGDLGRRAAWGA
jgi:anthraniloyl-CoA monooxygenase